MLSSFVHWKKLKNSANGAIVVLDSIVVYIAETCYI